MSDSATAIENAISTPWTTDDQAVVESMFSGADFFDLSAAGDTARGYGGNDKMFGYDGNDWLWSGLGNDKIKGQNDKDMLTGEAGKDTLTGGRGNDAFVFNATKDAGDKITDFHNKNGDNDVI